MPKKLEETLDPSDWESLRALSHTVIDYAVDYTKDVRERPVWQAMPADTEQSFKTLVPLEPTPLKDVFEKLTENVMPHPMGNIHPRFWMWYMGSSNFTGALGDLMAAVLGSNLGGGNHAAASVDRQVVDWLKQITGFPETASGTLVSGGSMANIIALTVARNQMAGVDIRKMGVSAIKQPLRFYSSDQVHACHQTAVELLGLGNQALRRVPSHPDCTIDVVLLRAAIAEDRASGLKPACVIANAGTVNTGAIDDLLELAALCREEDIWFHVDGCIGALLTIAPENKHRVAGIEKADSIAMDPHKWLHAPFEVGCALVRDESAHLGAFSQSPEYLQIAERGVASAPWLRDFGVQTSRGFRALKVWLSLQEHGIEKFGRLIDQNIRQADYLSDLIKAHPRLELVRDTSLNIVCYRYVSDNKDPVALKKLNTEIMLRMQEEGTAAISDTTVQGEHCLRVAINNHRTRMEDLDLLVEETVRLGDFVGAAYVDSRDQGIAMS